MRGILPVTMNENPVNAVMWSKALTAKTDCWVSVQMAAPPLERKLAAILAADVEGYSRLMNANEEHTLALLTHHRVIIDRLIEASHGQIFGTAGDSVLAEFPSVVQAFDCAVAIQQSLWHANNRFPDDEKMQLRIGINVGDVMVKSGDIFGDGVNIAARLEALAEAGGICVTRGVRDHLRDKVEAKFEDRGEHKVKNIARPIRVFRVVFDERARPGNIDEPPVDEIDNSANGEQFKSADAEIVFWQSVQASESLEEYRLYLDNYPNGQFAELAKNRLADPAQAEDPSVEVTFWESIRDKQNPALVRAYMEKYPQGKFRSLAKILLEDLSAPSQ
ncbi:adenylate/guanylate cyclase domain-containing protein [Rhizobium ruizarguesonis]|uniref:adenylate/guanylate cyclase domain-containing protein n=1 Tax=Rhizobium ruizarguesonis TaxID=2081791 RepID=UPI000A95F1ED|nr:adenylate/guanylate cyclase domain-containing protein [Rhizobium ruizarguesonis]UED35966.1 adenylate/guanylate cyclase domain-containing protein [Rhizobium ruizarguesonis]